jgi:formylglycine-generating enzyme required for sulfatase activity
MSAYQVTQELYMAVMRSNPSYFQGSETPADGEVQARRPVEQVSWYDAIVFCNTLSLLKGHTPVYTMSGSTNPENWGSVPASNDAAWDAVTMDKNADGYRLPTEAEWEYACRAGTTTAFYTGNAMDAVFLQAAWCYVNGGYMTHEVGLKKPNAWGLYDMHGNVLEWCWEWYAVNYGGTAGAAVTDPAGSGSGTCRVARGGLYDDDAQQTARSASRIDASPCYRYDGIGFRLARSAQ